MGNFFFRLFILLIINMAVSFFVSALIPNVYLANMVTSVVLAFLFSCFDGRGKEKFRTADFWSSFLFLSIIFLILDLITWMI